jgi:hypothetical protein
MPGFISGREVLAGKAFSVGVADGGNQTMVAVGGGVSVGTCVSVDGVDVDGRQALKMMHPAKRNNGMNLRME